jgi:RHS repeat-associated protein
MGNILTQERHKRDGTKIEDMSYQYQYANGKLQRNRLYHINDAVASTTDLTDIDDMGTFNSTVSTINTNNNYSYDEEGRLTKDVQEEISKIVWRVDGKVKEIQRGSDTSKRYIRFDYDAMGHRIAKHVYDNTGVILKKSTYYILDAQGNQVSMYEHLASAQTAKYLLVERNMFGSSRLGTKDDHLNMLTATVTPNSYTRLLGTKKYEFTNHLGNVLTIFCDVKVPLDNNSDGVVDSYRVCLQNTYDYSPFGVSLDGRTVESDFYRRGFNGMEKDDEFKGKRNSYDFGARMFDARLGRWLTIDPHFSNQPNQSSYKTFLNSPLNVIDPNGKDDYLINTKTGEIHVIKTDCSWDSFSLTTDFDGAYSERIRLEKNLDGYVNFPVGVLGSSRYGGVQEPGMKGGEEVGSGDHYLKPETAAGLIGLLYVAKQEGLSISMGDMSTSNGSDPGTDDFHHKGHGHMGKRSGLDIDFRYIGSDGTPFQGLITDEKFNSSKNQLFYVLAFWFGFDPKNTYQGKGGGLEGVKKMGGHDNHGHLGMDKKFKNITIIGHADEGYICNDENEVITE